MKNSENATKNYPPSQVDNGEQFLALVITYEGGLEGLLVET